MEVSRWNFLGDDPGIPGLNFRPVDLVSERDQVLAVIQRSCAADGVDRLRHWRGCNSTHLADRDGSAWVERIVAVINGRMVAFAEVKQEGEAGHFSMDGHVLADWRCCGIGSALIDHIETTCRARHANFINNGAPILETCAQGTMTSRRQLLQDRGFEIFLYRFEFILPKLTILPIPTRLPEFGISQRNISELPTNIARGFERLENAYCVMADEVTGAVGFFDEDENRQFARKRGYIRTFFGNGQQKVPQKSGIILSCLAYLQEAGMQEAVVNADVEVEEGSFDFSLYVALGFHLENRLLMVRKEL
jgi:GNAT superfamily N-acetyltransferase